jgi:hypothetical protein
MSVFRQAVLRFALNYPTSVLLRTWPITKLIIAMRGAEVRASAEGLLHGIALIRNDLPQDPYARVTRKAISICQSRLERLEREIRAVLRCDIPIPAERIDKLREDLANEKDEVVRLQDQNSRWSMRASGLRQRRRELASQVAKWSPAWQRLILPTFSAVDSILGSTPRSVVPDQDLDRAEQRLSRVENELKHVTLVARWHAAGPRMLERMEAVHADQLATDSRAFLRTMQAAGNSFNQGDYTAASQHYLAAFSLATTLRTAERLQRERGRSDAKQWLAVLGADEQAASLSHELTTVLEEADGNFIPKWKEIHDRIKTFALKRAIESGNRNQRFIARGISKGQIVHWDETLKLEEITQFAETVARHL